MSPTSSYSTMSWASFTQSFPFFQLLGLLEVIIDNAESKRTVETAGPSIAEPSGSQVSVSDVEMNAESGGITSVGASSSMVDTVKKSTEKSETDAQAILLNLPQSELRLLCSLLAKEGY